MRDLLASDLKHLLNNFDLVNYVAVQTKVAQDYMWQKWVC